MARKPFPRQHNRRGGICRHCGSDLIGRDICPCVQASADAKNATNADNANNATNNANANPDANCYPK